MASKIAERLRKSRQRLSKQAQAGGVPDNTSGHATDENLDEEREENHPSGDVSQEVKDIGGAGVDGTEPGRDETEGSPARVDEDSQLSNTAADPVEDNTGGHPTDQNLKEQGAAKTAQAIQDLRESGQRIDEKTQNVEDQLGALIKACQTDGDASELQAAQKETQAKEEDSEDSEDAEEGGDGKKDQPAESNLEDASTEEESEQQEASEEDKQMAEKAAEMASGLVDEGISMQEDMQKLAALNQQAENTYRYGWEKGIKLAQALDAEAVGAMEGGMAPPAPPVPPEELAAIVEMLRQGKQPETDQEEALAALLSEVEGAGSPELEEGESDEKPSAEEQEKSKEKKDSEESEDGTIKEDLPLAGMASKVAKFGFGSEAFMKAWTSAKSAEAQTALLDQVRKNEQGENEDE